MLIEITRQAIKKIHQMLLPACSKLQSGFDRPDLRTRIRRLNYRLVVLILIILLSTFRPASFHLSFLVISTCDLQSQLLLT